MSEPLKVWRRPARPAPAIPMVDHTLPTMCGGPDLTLEETAEYLAERRRAEEEAQDRAREEEADRKRQRHPSAEKSTEDDDEDEYRKAERYRNDRYAVKLLHQDESIWDGRGSAGPGVLG